jgi:hypothetical protein
MRDCFLARAKQLVYSVPVLSAVDHMEVVSNALGHCLRALVPTRGVEETLDLSKRPQGQYFPHVIQNRALRELTSSLLVKAKNDGIGWRVNQASAENVTNAAGQHKIIVPFASHQGCPWEGFGQLPLSAMARRIQGRVMVNVLGFERCTQARRPNPIDARGCLAGNDHRGARGVPCVG